MKSNSHIVKIKKEYTKEIDRLMSIISSVHSIKVKKKDTELFLDAEKTSISTITNLIGEYCDIIPLK